MTTKTVSRRCKLLASILPFVLYGCAAAPQVTCPPPPQPPQELIRELPQNNRQELDKILKSAETSDQNSTPSRTVQMKPQHAAMR